MEIGKTRLERRLQQMTDDGLFNAADAQGVQEQVGRDGQLTPTEQRFLTDFYNDQLVAGPNDRNPDEKLVVDAAARNAIFDLIAAAAPLQGVLDPVRLSSVEELPQTGSDVYVPRTVEANLHAAAGSTTSDVVAKVGVKPEAAGVVPTQTLEFKGATSTGPIEYVHYLDYAFGDSGGLQPGTKAFVDGTFFDGIVYGDNDSVGAAPVAFREGAPSVFEADKLTLEMYQTAPLLAVKSDNARLQVYSSPDASLGYSFDGQWYGTFSAHFIGSFSLDRDTKLTISLDGAEYDVMLTAGMDVLAIDQAIQDSLPQGYQAGAHFEGATFVRRVIPQDVGAQG